MILESIELQGVGLFRTPARVGPLEPGLNILAKPNEWGKSTVIRALALALFDKYTAGHTEVRSLRTAGTSLAPQIGVTFRSGGARYRTAKQFIEGKSSEFFKAGVGGEWLLTDRADKADQRVRELIGAPPLGSLTARPETWGLIKYLWCRQDEPADWPCWEKDEAGATLRGKLASVTIDSEVRALKEQFREVADALLKQNGQARTNSALAVEEGRVAELERELQECRARRTALAEAQQQYAAVVTSLPRLETERGELATAAAEAKAAAEAAEKVLLRASALKTEYDVAVARLEAARRDQGEMTALSRQAEEIAAQEVSETGKGETLRDQESGLLSALEQARSELRAHGQARTARAQALAAIARQLRARAIVDERTACQAVLASVEVAAEELRALETERERLPRISPAQMKKLRDQERQLGESRARLEAAGLRVVLRPAAGSGSVFASLDGNGEQAWSIEAGGALLSAAQSARLTLEGWGTVEITSGADEPAKLHEALAELEADFQAGLAALGARTVAEAEVAVARATDLETRAKSAAATLAALLQGKAKTVAELQSRVTQLEGEASRLQDEESDGRPAGEAEATTGSLRSREEELRAEEETAAAREAGLERRTESTQAALEAYRRRLSDSASALAILRTRAASVQEQKTALAARYSQPVDDAVSAAGTEFVKAEARLNDARGELPPHAEALPKRAGRAAAALAEVEREYQQCTLDLERLKTVLVERGGEGLHEREAELAADLDTAKAAALAFRRKGLAARLLHELVTKHEQTAIRAVLAPLEDKLSDVFRGLTGVPGRRVWFDEELQIQGVGPGREEFVRYQDLSRGAREQLLLALRAAVALQLAADGQPHCLVLDDVLVHTDSARHQNVLDYLCEISERTQVLLLTCHAERYRGVGHVVPVEGR